MSTRQPRERELAQARAALSRRGLTQREAARQLGVTHEHLNRVLCGHRVSRRILREIAEMTAAEEVGR